jgi:hypothetical protein
LFFYEEEIVWHEAIIFLLLLGPLTLNLLACGERPTCLGKRVGPTANATGAKPTLIPTVNIALAKGWPAVAKPAAAVLFPDQSLWRHRP